MVDAQEEEEVVSPPLVKHNKLGPWFGRGSVLTCFHEDPLLGLAPLLVPLGLWSLWKLYEARSNFFFFFACILYVLMLSLCSWRERNTKVSTEGAASLLLSESSTKENSTLSRRASIEIPELQYNALKLDEELVIREAYKELKLLCMAIGIEEPRLCEPASTPQQAKRLLDEIERICLAVGINKPPNTDQLEEIWDYIQTINALVGLPSLRRKMQGQ